jgi:hypothetical protein
MHYQILDIRETTMYYVSMITNLSSINKLLPKERTMGRLRLMGHKLLSMGKGADNAHQLALRSRKSYPTVKKYLDEEVKQIDLDVLSSVLIDGQEMKVEDLLNLRLGDLFEYVAEPD